MLCSLITFSCRRDYPPLHIGQALCRVNSDLALSTLIRYREGVTRRNNIERECDLCGGTYSARKYDIDRGRSRFCSIRCRCQFGRSTQDTTGPSNPNWKGGVWRENTRIKAREWHIANPEKRRAHHVVQNAIETGALKRQPCVKCGATPTDAHHEDYTRPLDVEWLCRRCHLNEHRRRA